MLHSELWTRGPITLKRRQSLGQLWHFLTEVVFTLDCDYSTRRCIWISVNTVIWTKQAEQGSRKDVSQSDSKRTTNHTKYSTVRMIRGAAYYQLRSSLHFAGVVPVTWGLLFCPASLRTAVPEDSGFSFKCQWWISQLVRGHWRPCSL